MFCEDEETGLYYNRFRYYEPEVGNYISQDPVKLIGGIQLYGNVNDPNCWVDILGLTKSCPKQKKHSNSKSSSKAQHGYEIYNNKGEVVKTGVSSGDIRKKDGKSVRAEKQVRKANANPHKKGEQPYTSKIVKQIPKQRNARKKIYKWEAKNADANRATLDPDLHQIP